MKPKSDSQLKAERLGAENAVLLLDVVDSILRRIDPPTTNVARPATPCTIVAYAHVRIGNLVAVTAALTGKETPSSLYSYLARVFEEQSAACQKFED